MKAIVQDRYGPIDALRLSDIGRPKVEEGQVLVRVHAASVHPDVWHVVTGQPLALRFMGAGLFKPNHRVPGTDVAGRVEAIGKGVTQFMPGDEVFGETARGHQWINGGAYAEYVSVPEYALALKPAALSFEEAASVPTSALIALHGLRDQGGLQAGQRVLVNGAGGGVGIFAVQIAKAYGATVTGVDSVEKLELLRSIGADHVVDYAQDDFTCGRERYDLILDIPGNRSFAQCRRVLAATGKYILIGHDQYGRDGRRLLGGLPGFFRLMALGLFYRQLPRPSLASPDRQDSMSLLKDLIEAGTLRPIVDRCFSLAEVPDALRYLAAGRARGKIVISI